ncbi:MAG: efflux RND transporter periplasmic adaptor subunit [Desulfobacterales bacterium]|nr:efflux RND transporter periplasmic adaptor subunit [Desulfobacterales bacterium]
MSFILKKKRGRAAAIVMAALLLLLNGCQKGKGGDGKPASKPEVATMVVAARSVELDTELPGRTAAYRVAEIRPQVNGIIIKELVKEGSEVEAGQLLYEIDPAPFKVALESAKASLAKAEANLPSVRARAERYKELLAQKAVSQQDFEDVTAVLGQSQAEVEYWKAAVEAARINLNYTRVTAPFAGRIGRSQVRTGTLVTAYQPTPFTVLQQLDPIYVDVVQSSSELLRLRRALEAGQLRSEGDHSSKVRIFLEDGTPYPLEGALQFADVSVDPTTGSFSQRIVVPNPRHLLLPGMFVRAVVKEGTAQQAILVPQQGVSRNSKGQAVALVVDEKDTVQQRILTIDRAVDDEWLVSDGLTVGDRLILEGMLKVRPGSVVKVAPMESGTATGNTGKEPAGTAASQK